MKTADMKAADTLVTYERRLSNEPGWALDEASRFFDEKDRVHETLRNIGKRLEEIGVPYAVAGGLALFKHGFRRFTEDVDILVTKAGLKTIHERLDGLGYVPPFAGSKNLRDANTGVKIEFLVSGDYPGDGKPKAIAFPLPQEAAMQIHGIQYVRLETLVELKLASGMTNAERLKDLSDVLELIKAAQLPLDLADRLHAFVRDKYRELWHASRPAERRYVMLWRNKFLTIDAKSLSEMADTLAAAANQLQQMQADGVTLDPDGGTGDDYAMLVTNDPDVARKYGMEDEREYLGDDEAESKQEQEGES
ncbi:MAG: nucleotidyltransferase family protein [Gemmataceae bacterium]|nr:nucleotidyltransferase family protein [Gemmataceae bacterium]